MAWALVDEFVTTFTYCVCRSNSGDIPRSSHRPADTPSGCDHCRAAATPLRNKLSARLSFAREAHGTAGLYSPMSDHRSSSTASFALDFLPSGWCGSAHLSTRRKLNLRRVPPGADPATSSAAVDEACISSKQDSITDTNKKKNSKTTDLPTAAQTAFTDTSRLEEQFGEHSFWRRTHRPRVHQQPTHPRLKRNGDYLRALVRLFLSPDEVALTPSRRSAWVRLMPHVLGWSFLAKQPITCASRCFKNGRNGEGRDGRSDEA